MNLFKKPLASSLAKQHLEEAQRQLLGHESSTSYHSKMAEHLRAEIRRLEGHINNALV